MKNNLKTFPSLYPDSCSACSEIEKWIKDFEAELREIFENKRNLYTGKYWMVNEILGEDS